MPSDTNSEIDCDGVMEDRGTFTVVKRTVKDKPYIWSEEAKRCADMLAPMPEAEQKVMVERLALAMGVKDGQYVGSEKPIPKWEPKTK